MAIDITSRMPERVREQWQRRIIERYAARLDYLAARLNQYTAATKRHNATNACADRANDANPAD